MLFVYAAQQQVCFLIFCLFAPVAADPISCNQYSNGNVHCVVSNLVHEMPAIQRFWEEQCSSDVEIFFSTQHIDENEDGLAACCVLHLAR
jgi:hypothetical protein